MQRVLASKPFEAISILYCQKMYVSSLSVASFPSTLYGSLILSEVNQSGCQSSPVGNAREEKLSRLIQLVIEAFLSHFQDIGNISHGEEVLHVVQAIGLRVRMSELGVDLWFPQSFPGHLEVSNKVVIFIRTRCNFDNLDEVRWILRLDVRV